MSIRKEFPIGWVVLALWAVACGGGWAAQRNSPPVASQPQASRQVPGDSPDGTNEPFEIPPEELEFPEPPGTDLGPSGDEQEQGDGLGREIPDLSDRVPMLPPALKPQDRNGTIELKDRNDVVDKFEMPTQLENQRFVYNKHSSFPDFKQVVFLFDVAGKLKRVDLIPATTITRRQLIERWGGGYSRKTSSSYEVLFYRRIGLYFFLPAGTDRVYLIRLKR